jgi:hypothetical protein
MLRKVAQTLTGITALAWIALIVPDDVVTAQGSREMLPPGPARTDCFIGRARILMQQSNIARTAAQQENKTASSDSNVCEIAT